MYKIKATLRKVFRLEDKQNPTAHQVNDREMMDALYQENKEAIDEYSADLAQEQAEKDQAARERAAAIAQANKEAKEAADIKKKRIEAEHRRKATTSKLSEKRAKERAKVQRKRMKHQR